MRSNKFDVNIPVTMCIEVEAQANNCKNKASVWTDLKNFFAWLTGMTKLIFDYNNLLAPVIFWLIFLDLTDRKMDGSKKVVTTKNLFFHARQPRGRIFEIVHNEGLFPQLFAPASTSVHIVTGMLTSKLFDLISLFWQDPPKNTIAGWIRDNRSHPNTYKLIKVL